MEVLTELFEWLKERYPRRSIPLPDREGGGWVLFFYQQVDRQELESWESSE